MSQRELARAVGLSESMMSRIEAGIRNPPRTVDFCDRLRALPGLTDAEAAALLDAAGVRRSPDTAASRAAAVSFVPGDGLLVELRLHPHAADRTRGTEDLADLLGALTEDVALSLRDYRRRVELGRVDGATGSGVSGVRMAAEAPIGTARGATGEPTRLA